MLLRVICRGCIGCPGVRSAHSGRLCGLDFWGYFCHILQFKWHIWVYINLYGFKLAHIDRYLFIWVLHLLPVIRWSEQHGILGTLKQSHAPSTIHHIPCIIPHELHGEIRNTNQDVRSVMKLWYHETMKPWKHENMMPRHHDTTIPDTLWPLHFPRSHTFTISKRPARRFMK
jgi:hypothetical protein